MAANFLDKNFGRLGNRMFQAAYIYAQFRRGAIPDVYLQDPAWFSEVGEEVRQMFRQPGPALDYISVHVRRGKNPANPEEPAYSENSFYVNLTDTDYYRQAMKRFPNERFLVFSDDLPWCIDNFRGKSISYYAGSELDDFSAMSRCKHNIIANSSFSWWAAYVNPNPEKIIIAPQAWYADGVERTKCPPEWIKI